MTAGWRLAGFLALVVGGCHAAPAEESVEPVPEAPPGLAAENARFDRLLAMEESGERAAAAAEYRGLATDAPAGRTRLRARLRLARCLEDLAQPGEAAELYAEALRDPLAVPSDDIPAPPGGAPFVLRAEAEEGLRRVSGDPVEIYVAMLRTPGGAGVPTAIVALGRLGDPRGREALLALAEDPAAPESVRALAADEAGVPR